MGVQSAIMNGTAARHEKSEKKKTMNALGTFSRPSAWTNT